MTGAAIAAAIANLSLKVPDFPRAAGMIAA